MLMGKDSVLSKKWAADRQHYLVVVHSGLVLSLMLLAKLQNDFTSVCHLNEGVV